MWNRGIKQYLLHILSLENDKKRKVVNERLSVLMTNLQEIMDFGWVAMELTNP